MLVPPTLPRFLGDMFDLKAIEGVPSDEEVKLVHAVIRSLNEVLHVPGLYDADLAVELSQYLFSIQMERYRDKYPCTIFPSTGSGNKSTTYIPPQLPAHIPATLEPVTNAPSNDQIKFAQTALRMSENLANVPSMFNADLSMELSQHLFDIQFERYLRKAASREHTAPVVEPGSAQLDMNESQGAYSGEGSVLTENAQNKDRHDTPATQQALSTLRPPSEVSTLRSEIASLQLEISSLKSSSVSPAAALHNEHEFSKSFWFGSKKDEGRHLKTGLEEAKQLISRLCDGMDDVKRTLIGTQHCIARGVNSAYRGNGYMSYWYSLVNAKGETPESIGLPSLSNLRGYMRNSVADMDPVLARFLRFYGIGEDCIMEGDALTIKNGERDKAKSILKSYLAF